MVAGRLREIGGYYYLVLSYRDKNGKRREPSFSTELPVKGNKKKANKLLNELRKNFIIPDNEEELKAIKSNYRVLLKKGDEISDSTSKSPEKASKKVSTSKKKNAEEVYTTTRDKIANMLFCDYMLYWLESTKSAISIASYASYESAITTRIAPYFKRKEIKVKDLLACDIQEFYTYCMNGDSERHINKVKANTVIHYHANIRKALEYARKMRAVEINEADLITRPKKEQFIGSYYNEDELAELFENFKDTKLEFAVIMASFYGLRRSEIVGLKKSAIDWQRKTITIRHTVTEITLKGKRVMVAEDKTKSKKSYRSLPLIPQVENLLKRMYAQQSINQQLCGNSYDKEYLDYIYVNEIGNLMRPNYITTEFHKLLKKTDLKMIRFHDLRHSCATLLLSQGIGMKDIQEWLGHEDITTTSNTYSHYEYKQKIKAADAISNVLPLMV